MKIFVLNGSPKGDTSVTMQYVAFMQKNFPQHDFKIVNIAQQIKKIIGIIKGTGLMISLRRITLLECAIIS